MTRQQALKWLQMDSQERIELVRSEMPGIDFDDMLYMAAFVEIDRECIARHNEAMRYIRTTPGVGIDAIMVQAGVLLDMVTSGVPREAALDMLHRNLIELERQGY